MLLIRKGTKTKDMVAVELDISILLYYLEDSYVLAIIVKKKLVSLYSKVVVNEQK